MAKKKWSAAEFDTMGLCWGMDRLQAAEANGPLTIHQILDLDAPQAETLYSVLREPVIPAATLHQYAGDIAARYLKTVADAFPGDSAFLQAVSAAQSGDEDQMAPARRAVHRSVRSGASGGVDPSILKAAKVIRAAVKKDAGQAAQGAAFHAMSVAAKPDEELAWMVAHLKSLTTNV